MEEAEKVKGTRKKFVTLCGRILYDTDPHYFPQIQYRGRTIYFCTESCLGAFLADPEIFYKVHRKSKNDKAQSMEQRR